MLTLTVTIGLPASGKSTWADEQIAKDGNIVNINRDDIRLMLQGRSRYNKFTKAREKIVTQIAKAGATSALLENKSVIISDTNLDPNRNLEWKKIADECNATYKEELFIDVPLGELLKRDVKREFPVSQRVIERMFNQYKDIYWPSKIKFNPDLSNAYIVDLDGTLAQMVNRGPFEWGKVIDDLPKQDVIDIVNSLYAQGNDIIICSGRDGVCKDDSIKWLRKHKVNFNEFFIRSAGDYRKDSIVKREIFDREILNKYNVKGVFDDRDSVTWMWRDLGLTVCQVGFGSF